MQKQSIRWIGIVLAITLLSSVIAYSVGQSSAQVSSSTVATLNQWAQVRDCSYQIFNDGTTYYAQNCDTGAIDYSGTSAKTVLDSVIGAMPASGGILFIRGSITLSAEIDISKDIEIVFDGWAYDNPNVLWTGSSGYVFNFNGGTLQFVQVKNMYIDGQTNGGSGIHLDSGVSRFIFENLGIRRMGDKGLVSDMGGGYIEGNWIELYDNDDIGFHATGTGGKTFVDIGTINAIGNGNDVVPTDYGVKLKNVEGNIDYLIASGGSASYGGRSDKGLLLEQTVTQLKIGVLHLETLAVTPFAVGTTVGAGSPATHDVEVGIIIVYDYTGSSNPIQLLSAANLHIGSIIDGGPSAANYDYTVEAPYNANFPNHLQRVTIGSIATGFALTGQLSDLHRNIVLSTQPDANLYKTLDPNSQSFSAGIKSLQTNLPKEGTRAVMLSSWTLPVKVGDVEPGIRINWSDSTNSTRFNTNTGSTLTEYRDDIQFGKDGVFIETVEFIANNTATTQSQDLGNFILEGYSVK